MYEQVNFLETRKRGFSLLPPVETVGFIPAKRDRVRRAFNSCNFSFILHGEGGYLHAGRELAVKAPCVLLQWPGAPMDYAPAPEWSEMFFIYPKRCFRQLTAAGIMDVSTPVRPLEKATEVQALAERLQLALADPGCNPDRIDLLCYEVLLKSWEKDALRQQRPPLLLEIEKRLGAAFGCAIDCQAIAADLAMSLTSLRRYWRAHHPGESFSDYRNGRFLQESSRLLVETALPLRVIAERLEFSDQFYFSKKFHQVSGVAPLEFRKKYQIFPLPPAVEG